MLPPDLKKLERPRIRIRDRVLPLLAYCFLSLYTLTGLWQKEPDIRQGRKPYLEMRSEYRDFNQLLDGLFDLVSRETGLEEDFLRATAIAESNLDVYAISRKGARGLMQLMPETAKEYCGLKPDDLWDPLENLYCGARILKSYLDEFGSRELALAAYNHGKYGTKRRLRQGRGFPIETRAYIKKVKQILRYL